MRLCRSASRLGWPWVCMNLQNLGLLVPYFVPFESSSLYFSKEWSLRGSWPIVLGLPNGKRGVGEEVTQELPRAIWQLAIRMQLFENGRCRTTAGLFDDEPILLG
ncbi:unnamed protein product [Prunus brigantina]